MITREDLYELVWSKPMIKVAEQFDVSGSYMARVCSVLRVPRPERGYWAKLAYGKAPTPQPLPEAHPGDQIFWSQDGDLRLAPVIKPAVPLKPRLTRLAPRVEGNHALIGDAKKHFESSRKIDEGQHLKPYKKLLVDITASKAGLDKALAFANDIFNAFESAGHRVVLAPESEQFRRDHVDEHEQPQKRPDHYNYYHRGLWSPYRPTVVYVGTLAIGLAVIEMSESVLMRYVNGKYVRDSDYLPRKTSRRYLDHTWTTNKDMPSGRLRLIAYSPYGRVSWSTNWQETKTATLTRDLSVIVKAIEAAAIDLVEKLKEADRQAEIAHQKWLVEQEKRRQEVDRCHVQQSIKDSHAQLGQIMHAWSGVMNVESFLQGIEDRASNLPAEERGAVLDRLKLARRFVGTQNPLDFFLAWKTPLERYQPLAMRVSKDVVVNGNDDNDDDRPLP